VRDIPLMSIASCNACQNHCENCAHQGMRDEDPAYQMGMEDVEALISRFKTLDCKIELVSICGPGEPLLWRHFNAAVRLLASSGIARRIESTTNGRALHVIAEDVWGLLTPVPISVYESPPDRAILERHPGRYVLTPKNVFWSVDASRIPVSAFAKCGCPGAMLYKGRVYPYCGPVLFDACLRSKTDHRTFSVPLEEFDPDKLPPMPHVIFLPCGWCWGNPLVPKVFAPHREGALR